MKALFMFCLACSSLFEVRGQNKEVLHEYYYFQSTCYYTFTENESSILTLYKDSSFQVEVFLNNYGNNGCCSRTSYTGLWRVEKKIVMLEYLTHLMETIAGKTLTTGFSPNIFVQSNMPVKCKIENENLITDSKVLSNMNSGKSKVMALAEKWRFENMLLATKNKKVKFNTLSIGDIKCN